MAGPHDKLIAEAARASLGPIGFVRKGRSRTWLADHSWWVTVVEFQPSSWSKGSYLNVSAHWLWSDSGQLSFDYGGRIAEHVGYLSDAQFGSAATNLAERAASEAALLKQKLSSAEAVAEILLAHERERGSKTQSHPRWTAYHAGVAAGLVGRKRDAEAMFASILGTEATAGSVLHPAAARMAGLVADPIKLKDEVVHLIDKQRDVLRLPRCERPLP